METRRMYCLQNADFPEKISQSSDKNVLDPGYNGSDIRVAEFHMKKTLLIPDDLPEAESQKDVQKVPHQSGHVGPEREGRSINSGFAP